MPCSQVGQAVRYWVQRYFAAAVQDGLTVFDSGGTSDDRAAAEEVGDLADSDGAAAATFGR